ncbi:MAG: hypothetical protein ACR2HP_07580 [Ilumatobacteraceae bacterium]
MRAQLVLLGAAVTLIGCGDTTTPAAAPAAPPPSTTTEPPATTVEVTNGNAPSGLAVMISDLGVDVAGAPAEVFDGDGERLVCGGEELGQPDEIDSADPGWNEPARRCFLDAHLAGMPTAFASSTPTIEGDPIVEVWLSNPDGVDWWRDTTRDAYGERAWTHISCDRVTTVDLYDQEPSPPTAFSCVSPSTIAEPTVGGVEDVPRWFSDRTTLPLCGYDVRTEDVADDERQCFLDAVNTGAPAELAYGTTGEQGERLARWARSRQDRTIELMELHVPADGSARWWYRYECSGTGFVEEDPEDVDFMLPRVDSTCVAVESDPADAPAPPTTQPDPTPDGCRRQPDVEMVAGTERIEMDVIFYGESSPTCGWDSDGDAMFNDDLRPAEALLTPDGGLAIAADLVGRLSVGIEPLVPDQRLANLAPGAEVPASADDGTYPVALPGPGCFVITVGWSSDGRSGQFVGLAETALGACATG